MSLTDEQYEEYAERIREGKVVHHNGRTAIDLAQLAQMRGFEDPENAPVEEPMAPYLSLHAVRALQVHNSSLEQQVEQLARELADARQLTADSDSEALEKLGAITAELEELKPAAETLDARLAQCRAEGEEVDSLKQLLEEALAVIVGQDEVIAGYQAAEPADSEADSPQPTATAYSDCEEADAAPAEAAEVKGGKGKK